MGLASSSSSEVASSASPKAVLQRPPPSVEWWVEPIKWVAVAVFLAIPIFAFLVQAYAGRVVWTVVVAALPLFIVLVGYHRWRRICPLAFLAQLPARGKRSGTHRAGAWLESNYYVVMLAVFCVALWLRLIATNGDGQALAAFFVLLALAALTFGFLYTGKTWCNYICPVSFVEKIYTEPYGLRQTRNSQCVKCSACKKSCPDINAENGYWKEIESAPKRFVYFAFPGLVFGFYFYYYLQSGSWDYYFSGSWANQPRLFNTAFLPGHDARTAGFFFLPDLPRALAAALTLAFCGLASVVVFSQVERLVRIWLSKRESALDLARVRHATNSLAAFSAFITFYSFAGAPTLHLVPWLHHLFLILVVGTATLLLVRRLFRTQQAFAEETLAKNIIKHWEWADVAPPKDLREAFLIHTIRSRESKKGSAQILEVYKNAVRETLANGYVSRQEVHLLESLRNQLHIKKSDHEQIMSELAEEERDLLSDPVRQLTAEKILQLESYGRVLESYLERIFAADGTPDDSFIGELRTDYHVTQEEHAAVLDKLLEGAGALASQLVAELKVVERTSHTIQVFAQEPMPAYYFFVGLMQHRRERAVKRVLRLLGLAPEDESSQLMYEGLSSSHRARREAAVERLCASLPKGTAEHLLSIYRDTADREARLTTMPAILRVRTLSTNPYVRAVALHLLGELGAADEQTRERLRQDEHTVVREVASSLDARMGKTAGEPLQKARLTTIEKVFALGAASMFSHLRLEGLTDLAYASVEAAYDPGETLCIEGEHGDEVFMLVEGEVTIHQRHGVGEHVIGTGRVGELIGEMAVLDPALRSATVRAGARGVRTLRLNGKALREVIDVNPTIATGIIRMLAQRLRGAKSVDNPRFPA
jgi:CRP-like cAMP-binding protein